MYRFTISKGDLSLIKKRGIDAYLERNRKYLFGVTSPKEDSMYFLHVETTINELEFMNEPPQQHRYIASKHLLDKLYNSIIDHGEIKNIKTKVIHFEKECFNLLGYEIKGILFFVKDGWCHSRINMKNNKGEFWISHQAEFIKNAYKSIDSVHIKKNSKHSYKSDENAVIAHVCAKVCLSAIVLESLGLTSVKKGLWRNRVSKYSRVNLLEYAEPSTNKTMTWHFRQLRNERFYRGVHKK